MNRSLVQRCADCPESGNSSDTPSPALCERALTAYAAVLKESRYPRAGTPECLIHLGLTPPLPDSPDFVYALPPSTASGFAISRLEQRVAEYQAAIRSTHAAFSALETVHAESSKRDGAGYSLIRGSETISEVLSASVAACRSELLTTQPGTSRPAELLARALESEIPRLRQGIKQRTIYQHKIRFDGPTMEYIDLITAVGGQVRTTSALFDRLIIIDRETAFIPVDDEREVSALQIHHPGIVRYLGKIFDHIWERAIDVGSVSAKHTPQISDTQRAILHHLVSGQTDEWIARRVGLSRRSIAEHVRKISEQLGSSSRAQLGYLIALNGVLWGAEGTTDPGSASLAAEQDTETDPLRTG